MGQATTTAATAKNNLPRAAMTSITDILTAWGRARSVHDAPNGYPSSIPFARMMRGAGTATLKSAPVQDDAMFMVDRILSDMRLRKPQHYGVLWLYYVENLRDHQIAERVHCSRSTARSDRMAAEVWVEAKMDNEQHAE